MTDRFELRHVQYMPIKLEPGILYVAREFGAAAHLCGTIVRTPLDRWSLGETEGGPSLDPSIGNWQEPCQSHYWIEHGEVRWAPKWSSSQIEAGRRQEEDRLRTYYDARDHKRGGKMRQFWRWLKNLV
jgi:hypothetical protein